MDRTNTQTPTNPTNKEAFMTVKIIAFDVFGTVLDMAGIPRDEIADYAAHTRHPDQQDRVTFTPYTFPQAWYGTLRPHPDSVEGICRLQDAGYLCVTLSNGPRDLIMAVSNRYGIVWDTVVDLAAYLVYKPAPGAYACVERATGHLPCETLMVTANPAFGDLQAARRLGMEAITIRHGYPDTILDLADYLRDRCGDDGGKNFDHA